MEMLMCHVCQLRLCLSVPWLRVLQDTQPAPSIGRGAGTMAYVLVGAWMHCRG